MESHFLFFYFFILTLFPYYLTMIAALFHNSVETEDTSMRYKAILIAYCFLFYVCKKIQLIVFCHGNFYIAFLFDLLIAWV